MTGGESGAISPGMSRTALLFIAISTITTASVVACDEQNDVSPRYGTREPIPGLSLCVTPPPPCECGDTSTSADDTTSTSG